MFSKRDYVYAVYTEKSFTKAAEKLFIAQPSLSAAIKKTEEKIGAPLFERTGQGARLTEVGREYITICEKMMCAEKEFAERLSDICNLETGHIAVGGANYLSSYLLPRIINRFKLKYPKISVTLTEAHSSQLTEMIRQERLDIVIDCSLTLPETYEGVELAREHILLCVPRDFEVNRGLSDFAISPDDIHDSAAVVDSVTRLPISTFAKEKFVLLKDGNDMYDRAMEIFSEEKISPEIAFRVDQLNMAYALAGSGMGVCFATDTIFKYGMYDKNVLLYNVGKKPYGRSLYIAHKKNRYCTKAMSEFIDAAKEVVRK